MNNFIKTDAFCLKVNPIRNDSAFLLFFTKELGVVSLFHRGFFSIKNSLSGVIDIGQEVTLLLKKYQNSLFLQETYLITAYNASDYYSLTLSSFVFELLSILPQKMELNSQYLYFLLKTLLYKMSLSSGEFNLILSFQIKLLSELGLIGDPEICSNCHKLLTDMESFSISGELNFLCSRCYNRSLKYNNFSAYERQVILSWLNNHDFNSTTNLGKNSVLKLQNHLNTIFNNIAVLKTLKPFMKIMCDKAVLEK